MENHIALYRKYRPQKFSDLVGQEAITKVLLGASKSGSFSHAYLFSGPRGTGKTSCARITAKAICCQTQKDGEPCTTCDDCLAIENGNHPDLIEMDAASHTSVEDVRDLIEKAQFMPTRSKKKVYIIDEAHMLSKSAFNALLKTLEEPPEHVHFILATTEPHKLLATIISRCIRFDFRKITNDDIAKRLEFICKSEGFTADFEALELIARQTNGGMRDAIGLLEQLANQGEITTGFVEENLGLTSLPVLENLYRMLQKNDVQKSLEIISTAANKGVDLSQFVKDFLEYTRIQMLANIAEKKSVVRDLEIVEALQKAGLELKTSVIPQLPLEVAVIKILNTDEVKIAPVPVKKTQSLEPKVVENKPVVAVKSEVKIATPQGDLDKNTLMENVKNPSLKMNLKTSEIEFLEEKIIVKNANDFFLEKLRSAEMLAEIKKSAQAISGKNYEVEVVKSEVKLENVAPVSAPVQAPASQEIDIDELNDIFG